MIQCARLISHGSAPAFQKIINEAIQLFGGYGMMMEYPMTFVQKGTWFPPTTYWAERGLTKDHGRPKSKGRGQMRRIEGVVAEEKSPVSGG